MFTQNEVCHMEDSAQVSRGPAFGKVKVLQYITESNSAATLAYAITDSASSFTSH